MEGLFENLKYDNANDEYLSKKFGYNYKYLKELYPNLSKLPEDEIRPVMKMLYEKDDSVEEAGDRAMSYIKKQEPKWNKEYFGFGVEPETSSFSFGGTIPNQYASMSSLSPREKYVSPSDKFDILDFVNAPYSVSKDIGKMVATGMLLKNEMENMKKAGREMVNEFGPNAADGHDNYYHALAQCYAARNGLSDGLIGLGGGALKEVADYVKKTWKNELTQGEILNDNLKDTGNNIRGFLKGLTGQSCLESIDPMRTENMRKGGYF